MLAHAGLLAESWGRGTRGNARSNKGGECGRRGSLGNTWRYGYTRVEQRWGRRGPKSKRRASEVRGLRRWLTASSTRHKDKGASNTAAWAPTFLIGYMHCLRFQLKISQSCWILQARHGSTDLSRPLAKACLRSGWMRLDQIVFSCCCTECSRVFKQPCGSLLLYYLGKAHLVCQEILRSGCSVPGLLPIPGS